MILLTPILVLLLLNTGVSMCFYLLKWPTRLRPDVAAGLNLSFCFLSNFCLSAGIYWHGNTSFFGFKSCKPLKNESFLGVKWNLSRPLILVDSNWYPCGFVKQTISRNYKNGSNLFNNLTTPKDGPKNDRNTVWVTRENGFGIPVCWQQQCVRRRGSSGESRHVHPNQRQQPISEAATTITINDELDKFKNKP